MDKSTEIAGKIKELRSEIEQQELKGVPAKKLAKYLVEVDKLTALMLTAHKNK